MFEDVCCFTGHRYLPADRLGEIKKRLEAESEACIRQGVILFETGGALGFDTMAAHTVLRLREGYAVRLRLVLPCPEQAKLWKKEDILVWRQIRQRADETVTVSPSLFQRLYAPAQPLAGGAQRPMHLLPGPGNRRHRLYRPLCAAEGPAGGQRLARIRPDPSA